MNTCVANPKGGQPNNIASPSKELKRRKVTTWPKNRGPDPIEKKYIQVQRQKWRQACDRNIYIYIYI